MKRYAITLSFLGAALLAGGGCASSELIDDALITEDSFALARLNVSDADTDVDAIEFDVIEIVPSNEAPAAATPTAFHLGAGDTLGQSVFMNYATLVRANPNWHFASAQAAD